MRLFDSSRFAAVLVAALLITACSGGGSSPLPHSLNPPTFGSAGDPLSLFVTNDLGTTGSVTVYDAGANGNVAPLAAIAGSNTQLGPAEGVAFDAAGNIYVSNKGVGCVTSCIAIFAAGASGNVAPLRTICGDKTQLTGLIGGIAVDSAGYIYVADAPESILVFAPGASGNVAPVRVINGSNTGLATPIGIALDAAGHLYVANETASAGPVPGSITEYAPGASGNAAPVAAIVGLTTGVASPRGLALANGNIYVTNIGAPAPEPSITVYPQGANGNVAPQNMITGPNTMLFGGTGIAVDASGAIYTANNNSPSYITVYAPGASGNATPARTIEGSNTQLGLPNLIALH